MTPRLRTIVSRALPAIVFLVIALTAIDFFRFVGTCLGYSTVSAYANQILPAKTETEAITVLTGDQHRISSALALLLERRSRWLVISGAGHSTRLTDLINEQKGSVANLHEIWDRIVVDSVSRTTIENAAETRRILEPKNTRRIILITSDYHMWRALKVFERLYPGVEYVPYPVASAVASLGLASDVKAKDWSLAAWRLGVEYVKTLAYRFNALLGWV